MPNTRYRSLLLGIPLLVLLTILVAGFSLYRKSLPSYHGTVTVSGVSAPVEIIRDEFAIPHVFARTSRDGAFGMGYAHAQDRLWQMELQRRIGSGRLSEIIGEKGIDTDRLIRTLGVYRVAGRNFRNLSPDVQEIYRSYSAGVNAYMDATEDLLPVEFTILGHQPEPWHPVDSLVWLKMMAWTLGDNFEDELLRARLRNRLSMEQIRDLWAQHPDDPPAGPHSDTETSGTTVNLYAPEALMPKLSKVGVGSNSWAVSGKHTRSGTPLLASDPHLQLDVPSYWYLAHVHTPEYEIIGATLPGLPLPLVGQTRNFAWGFTYTGSDVQDIVIEKVVPGDPTRYVTESGSLPFQTREEIIIVRGQEPVRITLRETRHGPVISDAISGGSSITGNEEVLSLSWTVLSDDDLSGEAVIRATTADTIGDFINGLRYLVAPQMNTVFADGDGNIGFIAPGRVPIRATGQGHMPTPGWNASRQWIGHIPFGSLPDIMNPDSGRIISANNRITPPDYPYFITDNWTPPYRARRIDQLLDSTDSHTVESFTAMQQDIFSRSAARLLPELTALLDSSRPEHERPLLILKEWDFFMRQEEPAPLIYMAWLRELTRKLFADELGEMFEDYWKINPEVILHVLSNRPTWCDDISSEEEESCPDMVSRSFSSALNFLSDRHGEDLEDWQWGKAHAVLMRNRFLGEIPFIGSWFNIEMPTGGERETVNAGGFDITDDRRPFSQNHGAGYRAVYDLSDPERSVFIISTGQSGNPFSPHYRSFAEYWRKGKYLPMQKEKGDIQKNALGSLVLKPK